MTPIWLHRGMGAPFEAAERFVASRVGNVEDRFAGDTALAVIDKRGGLVACIIYHNYSPANGVMEFSGAAVTPRWLTKPVLHEMFAYPFEQVGCQTVVARVSANDDRLGRMLPAYGFTSYRLPRLRGRDEDEILYVLHDDVWRANGFHKVLKYGKKIAPGAHSAA